jgi:hypothetical protein
VTYRLHIVAACTLLLLIGCAETTLQTPSEDGPDSVSNTESIEVAAVSSSVDVSLVNATQFDREMEACEGKVVLLDMWATW